MKPCPIVPEAPNTSTVFAIVEISIDDIYAFLARRFIYTDHSGIWEFFIGQQIMIYTIYTHGTRKCHGNDRFPAPPLGFPRRGKPLRIA